jgi:hypothetical protein
MTTPAAPVLAVPVCTCVHGSRRRYRVRSCHRPCRCTPCKAAQRRYDRERYTSQKAGKPYSYPVEQIAAHLEMLAAHRITRRRICTVTGISPSTLQRIVARVSPIVMGVVADEILAISPDSDLSVMVDAIGTRRRAHALMTLGYSYSEQGRLLGDRHSSVVIDNVHRDTITRRRAERHKELYDKLYATESTSVKAGQARRFSADQGFDPPEAWTDETIDNPAARPWQHLAQLGPRREHVEWVKVWRICEQVRRYNIDDVTPAERNETVHRLNRRGLNDQEIAERTGWSDRTVLRVREQLGLAANMPFTTRGPRYCARDASPGEHITRLQRRWRTVLHSKHSSRVARADARTALADLDIAAAALAEVDQEAA